MKNRQFLLRSRPQLLPDKGNFELVETEIPTLQENEVLIQHEFLGLVPSSRIRMSAVEGYDATPLGSVVAGQGLGTVIDSRNKRYHTGQKVMTPDAGWQEFSINNGRTLRAIEEGSFPLSYWLSALGTSGNTAYVGMKRVGQVRPSDRVVVSAAGGAVGSIAAQIARIEGASVIGLAGGESKCEAMKQALGLIECLDYRAPSFAQQVNDIGGVDLYYDNVGGPIRDLLLKAMREQGRIVVCGLIAEYSDINSSTGPSWFPILFKRLRVEGFLLRDHDDLYNDFLSDMLEWVNTGQLHVQEYVTKGFENTPDAFIAMLAGRNLGKTLVEL